MSKVYQPLGPLLSGAGSRAFLGLEVARGVASRAIVLVWVPDEIAKDPEALVKIERETIRAAALEHPNIIKVYGLATLDEGTARVVEFADGESLRKVLNVVEKLPPRLAALVVADAATGAQHAHVTGDDAPLVHGDIRPETLMVAFSGVCKVAGYGALGVAPKEQGGRRVQGRRTHCAPEQILGGRDAINRQTDVYLLGLVLYECLTGCVPFTDAPNFDDAVLHDPVPLLLPDVPPALIKVVEKAMAKKSSDRFRTAAALRDAIEQAVGTLPPHEELEAFLRPFFPADSPERSARRREIESGIADQDRRAEDPEAPNGASEPGAGKPPSPSEVSSPEELSPSVASLHRAKGRYVATYVGSLLLILTALGYSYLERAKEPVVAKLESGPTAGLAQQAPSPNLELAQPSAKQAAAPTDSPAQRGGAAGSQATTGSVSTDSARPTVARAPARIETAVAQVPADSAPESSLITVSAPSGAAQSSLELTVDPPVEVTIDGRALGRSPVSIALAPGKHVLQFTDPSRGINVSRAIEVGPGAKTSQQLVIGKSVVRVDAPAGAAIYVDGKPVGTAPIDEISVFEGKHRILATLGTGKWQQGFSVSANERMSFKIESIDR